ncbi:MAG TPA: hypothetical protein VG435_12525 [Acidimicrobiales bacterium]|nr:hypothetical protein [Acidimicrobiales bacterium]
MTADGRREWSPDFPVSARLTLGALRMGARDPCHQVDPDGSIWRVAGMRSGPVTYRIRQRDLRNLTVDAWGDGTAELLDGVPDLLGAGDDPETFVADHPVLEAAEKRLVGLRVPRTGLVVEALIGAVLHQKISGRDAVQSWQRLVRRFGAPAPGPRPDLRVPPTPQSWLDVRPWDWRRVGVEPSAVDTIRLVASRARSLERETGGDLARAYRAMTSLRGIGRWTAAEVGHRALGDADALSVGDYHLVALTSHALAGRELAEDEVEPFYERWRPHRYRAMRLIELTPSAWPARRGPRMERPEHRYGDY